MKLQNLGLFHTPKDWDELKHWIEAHHSDDRIHVMTAAAMAWNLAGTYVEQEDVRLRDLLTQVMYWLDYLTGEFQADEENLEELEELIAKLKEEIDND